MSIFSSIRKSHNSAKEYNAKLAEQKKNEDRASAHPYRHVPTHAAIDAIASAPPSWREAGDRPKIVEQNRRRSAMALSGAGSSTAYMPISTPVNMHMMGPGVPRSATSLSFVSYPGPSSAVPARVPRSHSYSGVSPYPGGGRDVIYSIPDITYPDLDDGKQSRSASTSSQEDLELRRPDPASLDRQAMSNAATLKAPGPSSAAGSPSSAPRPPLSSTRALSSIGYPAPGPVRVGTAPTPLPVAAMAAPVQDNSAESSRQNSASSLPGLTPTSTKLPSPAAPASPAAGYVHSTELGDASYFPQTNAMAVVDEKTEVEDVPQPKRVVPRQVPDVMATPRTADPAGSSSLAFPASIVNSLPEPMDAEAEAYRPGEGRSKRRSKLFKKSRW